MKEPKLYLMVMEFTSDQECEWTHFVADKAPDTDEEIKIAKQFMRDNHDAEEDDFEQWGLFEFDSIWTNQIEEQDGYKINLEKIT